MENILDVAGRKVLGMMDDAKVALERARDAQNAFLVVERQMQEWFPDQATNPLSVAAVQYASVLLEANISLLRAMSGHYELSRLQSLLTSVASLLPPVAAPPVAAPPVAAPPVAAPPVAAPPVAAPAPAVSKCEQCSMIFGRKAEIRLSCGHQYLCRPCHEVAVKLCEAAQTSFHCAKCSPL